MLEDVEMEYESVIPVLPKGRIVEFEILSSWGDKNYVGLNGVEFWDRNGLVIIYFSLNFRMYHLLVINYCYIILVFFISKNFC